MSLRAAGIMNELFGAFYTAGIEAGSPEAYDYIENAYINSELDRHSLKREISLLENDKRWLRKQRNYLAVIALILAALCLFLALRPTADPAPAPTPTVSATRSTSTSRRNYVASVNSNKYHLPTCDYAENILDANRVFYATEADAKADGKKPCSVCNP